MPTARHCCGHRRRCDCRASMAGDGRPKAGTRTCCPARAGFVLGRWDHQRSRPPFTSPFQVRRPPVTGVTMRRNAAWGGAT